MMMLFDYFAQYASTAIKISQMLADERLVRFQLLSQPDDDGNMLLLLPLKRFLFMMQDL